MKAGVCEAGNECVYTCSVCIIGYCVILNFTKAKPLKLLAGLQ